MVVGIRLSRETMESAPKFSQWLSCSACCGRAVRFWVSRFCCSCCRSTRTWLCGCSVLPSHCSFLLSSHAYLFSKPPVISVCSYSFPIWELILPAFRVRLQTTTGLVPVVSLLYNGICPSFMPLTWPSQPSRLWLSKANVLGNPACATTSLFGTQSCQVMPKILLRQRRWKVLSLRSWQE